MEKEFIPYEQALALKELGFEEPCIYAWCIKPKHRVELLGDVYMKTDGNPFGEFYKGNNWNANFYPNKNKIQCSALTYSQAFRWFREKHFHYAFLQPTSDSISENYCFKILDQYSGKFYSKSYETHEEAELACLKKLIEMSKSLT